MTNSVSLTNKQEQRFRSLALLTVLIVYLVILAGGIVRGTGSGMGCPDWPKCFGRWVPPTDIAQLPSNYQEIYGAKLKGEIEFNAVKTWIEYVNRLLGVLSGFFVFGTLVASLAYLKKDKAIFWGSFAAFILIGITGWLGSRVVATELAQYMITIHLLLAILVAFVLLFVLARANSVKLISQNTSPENKPLKRLLLGIILVTIVQVALGTQVRDVLDKVVKLVGYEHRADWIGQLNWTFYVHRSYSLMILGLHIYIIYQLRKAGNRGVVRTLANVMLTLVLAEIGTGIVMAYFGVPAIAQPIHLELAMMLIGVQFVAWLTVNPSLLGNRSVRQTLRFVEV